VWGEVRETGTLLPGLPHLSEAPQGSAAADWVWGRKPRAVQQGSKELFAAHFVLGREPGDPVVADEPAANVSMDSGDSPAGLPGGSAPEGGAPCETLGRESAFRARLRGWLLGE
jgi:hypothetical protein